MGSSRCDAGDRRRLIGQAIRRGRQRVPPALRTAQGLPQAAARDLPRNGGFVPVTLDIAQHRPTSGVP
jgi:hypothetical protein